MLKTKIKTLASLGFVFNVRVDINIPRPITMFKISNIRILSGDLPENGEQNGVIDSYDISFIRNNLGKTEESVVNICDINLDNICDTQDYSLLIQPLGTGNKYDEEY